MVKEDYVPSVDDILRVRVRTTGIDEAQFIFQNFGFTMIDVGGQRSERRKWIHCFDNVTAVIYCASLADYDMFLREDDTQNRMVEALLLFREITHSTWCKNNSIIIFLNKTDLFDEKIKRVPLKSHFEDYQGEEKNSSVAKEFIKDKFLEQAMPSQYIYCHYTCALSTENIQFVLKSVKDTLLRSTLDDCGL